MISPVAAAESASDAPPGFATAPSFEALYQGYFGFVWRTLWRLGVWHSSVADAAQDVFLVIHRRHGDLLGHEVARSWVYGIVVRVARDYRRSQLRKGLPSGVDPDEVSDPNARNPAQRFEVHEAVVVLNRLLDTLDDEKREVLVLVELEQMTVPEIAELLGANPNTIYTRLRAARQDFARALARQRHCDRRQP
jgi:RNA polymerase sigma-70 factor (ECF subfamily)